MTPEEREAEAREWDERTGLPPLNVISPTDAMLTVMWVVTEGTAHSPTGDDVPVKYLSVRGLALPDPDTDPEGANAVWSQVHIAIPTDMIGRVAATLLTDG